LPSIQAVEGGYVGAEHLNTNSSADLGVMQINTSWLLPLAVYVTRVAGTPVGANEIRKRLVSDSCFNIAAAGLILRSEWERSGRDWSIAVGNYHSHTFALNRTYLSHVIASARVLFRASE